MGFSTTCHLSSIEIIEGDDVILLPVEYTYLRETKQLVYATNSSVSQAWLPLFGKYNDWGGINIDKKSIPICDLFRAQINKNLMNNKSVREEKSKRKFSFGDHYFVFKRDNYNEAQKGEFLSDSCLNKYKKEDGRFLDITEIKDNDTLLSLLADNSLFEISSDNPNRFGYVLIRADIYKKTINGMYSKESREISKDMKELMSQEWNDDLYFEIGEDKLKNVLGFFNCSNGLIHKSLYEIKDILREGFENCTYLKDFNKSCVTWGLLEHIYRDLGKSLYPNVRKHNDMKPIYDFNNIVNSHIEKRRTENLDYWSVENGYGGETTKNEEWNDHNKQ